jgi:hypothetical protein
MSKTASFDNEFELGLKKQGPYSVMEENPVYLSFDKRRSETVA